MSLLIYNSDMKYAIRKEISGAEIKRIRKKNKLTQEEFANICNTSKKTIQRWEASEVVSGSIVSIIELLIRNDDFLEDLTIPPRNEDYPLRLNYYDGNRLCTTIDVDDVHQKVKIKNYVDFYLDRAFGNNKKPTYDDYQEFLSSRCFPSTRDKMKLILKDLNLPFYDPYMIVEKTKGRMAEDNFWIDIIGVREDRVV